MGFTNTKYELNSGDIAAIRVSDADLGSVGSVPSGAQNLPFFVKVSKTNREFGVRPRGVRLSRSVGTPPNDFKKFKFLPVLTASAWAGTGFDIGDTITIGTTDWIVAAKVAEDY